MDIKRVGLQPSANGPAAYFTGSVRIDAAFAGSGVTREEVSELMTHLALYGGWAVANSAMPILRAEFAETEGLRQEVKLYNFRTTIISPGAVPSELPQSINEADVAPDVAEFCEKYAIPADSFAAMVAFAIC